VSECPDVKEELYQTDLDSDSLHHEQSFDKKKTKERPKKQHSFPSS